jgi:hypothetical protein
MPLAVLPAKCGRRLLVFISIDVYVITKHLHIRHFLDFFCRQPLIINNQHLHLHIRHFFFFFFCPCRRCAGASWRCIYFSFIFLIFSFTRVGDVQVLAGAVYHHVPRHPCPAGQVHVHVPIHIVHLF